MDSTTAQSKLKEILTDPAKQAAHPDPPTKTGQGTITARTNRTNTHRQATKPATWDNKPKSHRAAHAAKTNKILLKKDRQHNRSTSTDKSLRRSHLRPAFCCLCAKPFTAITGKLRSSICPECFTKLAFTLTANNPEFNPYHYATPEFGIAYQILPLCYFQQHSAIQRIIHLFKYGNRPDLARQLGVLFAATYQKRHAKHPFDAVVPVPLHWRRRLKRGYNQSLLIAKGISQTLDIPILQPLRRAKHTKPQALFKNHELRKKNLHGAMALKITAPQVQNLHLLLIDDVITTGSTIAEPIRLLAQLPGVTVSVGCLAIAPGLEYRNAPPPNNELVEDIFNPKPDDDLP